MKIDKKDCDLLIKCTAKVEDYNGGRGLDGIHVVLDGENSRLESTDANRSMTVKVVPDSKKKEDFVITVKAFKARVTKSVGGFVDIDLKKVCKAEKLDRFPNLNDIVKSNMRLETVSKIHVGEFIDTGTHSFCTRYLYDASKWVSLAYGGIDGHINKENCAVFETPTAIHLIMARVHRK
jgi:hypothetical protein